MTEKHPQTFFHPVILITWVGRQQNKPDKLRKTMVCDKFCCIVVSYNNRHEALELYKHFHEAQSRASYDISLAYLGFDWGLRHPWNALLQHNWNYIRLPCWIVIYPMHRKQIVFRLIQWRLWLPLISFRQFERWYLFWVHHRIRLEKQSSILSSFVPIDTIGFSTWRSLLVISISRSVNFSKTEINFTFFKKFIVQGLIAVYSSIQSKVLSTQTQVKIRLLATDPNNLKKGRKKGKGRKGRGSEIGSRQRRLDYVVQANAEGLPNRIHSKFIHEAAAAVHVDDFCDTELGVKLLWSIGGATRRGRIDEGKRMWELCVYLTSPQNRGKNWTTCSRSAYVIIPRYKGLGMSNKYSVFATTPTTLLFYVNLAATNIDRGQCDETTLSLWLTLRNVCIFIPFMGLRVSLDWIEYVRTSGQGLESTFDDGRQYSHKGMRSPMPLTCSESTNCWKPCQPKENGWRKLRHLWLRHASDIWTMIIKFIPVRSYSCFGWFCGLVHLITSYPLWQRCFVLPLPKPKVLSMANPSDTDILVPTIQIVGEYNPLAQSVSCLNCIQNSLGSLVMNFHNHWLSSTPTRRMVPVISETLKGNSRKTSRESSILNWQANGELNATCLSNANHSHNVVLSSKEVTWILRYTESILCDGRSPVLGISQRMILCVKPALSLTIYGITWYLKHRKEPNVSLSFPRLLQTCSEYFQQILRWNSSMELQDYDSGSLPRYAIMVAVNM